MGDLAQLISNSLHTLVYCWLGEISKIFSSQSFPRRPLTKLL